MLSDELIKKNENESTKQTKQSMCLCYHETNWVRVFHVGSNCHINWHFQCVDQNLQPGINVIVAFQNIEGLFIIYSFIHLFGLIDFDLKRVQ